MADAPGRVAIVSPTGERGTIDATDLDTALSSGAKVVSSQQLAEEKAAARYDALPIERKAAGALSVAGALVPGIGPLAINEDAPPTLAALGAGTRSTLLMGADEAAKHALIKEFGGADKAAEHQRQYDETKAASPVAYGAGQAYGFGQAIAASGIGGAARALPQSAISAAGGGIEVAVAKALGGLAETGALGRAATTAASMGVRGAVEGAAMSGIDQATNSYVHDTPVFGEKLYSAIGHGALAGGLLGGALGGSGSLIASGARSVLGGVSGALHEGGELALHAGGAGRGAEDALMGAARKVDDAATRVAGAADDAVAKGRAAIDDAVTKGKTTLSGAAAEAETLGARGIKATVGDVLANPNAEATKRAGQQAWDAFGAGFGMQSTDGTKKAAKFFEGGTSEIGNIAIREGIIDTGAKGGSAWRAALDGAKNNSLEQIVSRASSKAEEWGGKVGAITEASGAKVSGAQMQDAFERSVGQWSKSAAHTGEMGSIRRYAEDLAEQLGMAARDENGKFLGFAPDAEARVQDVLAQRKFLDQAIYEGRGVEARGLLEMKRQLRGSLEGVITDALDAASSKVPGAERAAYDHAKKQYMASRIILDIAEDSAARAAKAPGLGFSEKIGVMTALGSGNVLAAPVLALGGKLIKERGNAAAAAFLTRAVESGQLASAVAKFDAKVTRAAAGVMRDAAPATEAATVKSSTSAKTGRAEVTATQAQASKIIEWMGKLRENPARLSAQLEEASASVARAAGPKAAESYTASTVRALAFIAAHVPPRDRRDPLDPRSIPPLTHDEADRLARATKYAMQPSKIFDDFHAGIVTPEGIRAAKTFSPEAFASFQLHLQDEVTKAVMAHKVMTSAQRIRIDRLLEVPAGAEYRPETIALLQAHLAGPTPDEAQDSPQPQGGGGNKAVNMKIPSSGFDAVEARKSQQ